MIKRFWRSLYSYLRRGGAIIESSFFRATYDLPSLRLEKLISPEVQIEELIFQDVCLPPYAGSTDHDDLLPLMKIVKSWQPRVVVELGTAYGNIAANICQQCPGAKVYTVNALIEDQTGTDVTYELSPSEIGRVYRASGFANRVRQIFKNTLELDLSEYLNGASVDLAVIDACHDTPYVMNDFMKVLPFMSEHGLVLFHDTDPDLKEHLKQIKTKGHLIGSYLACLKLRKQGFDVRHIAGTWWAVWSRVFPVSHPSPQPLP